MEAFISFASREQILWRLRERSQEDTPARRRFYDNISERLAERSYDPGAFSFIVMEEVYDPDGEREEQAEMLLDCILGLTRDRQLAIDTLHAFDEINP